jgi:hypothetical protein
VEIQKKIVVKELAQNQLLNDYDYYDGNYSVIYAEQFKSEFYEIIQTILPNPYIYTECRFLTTKTHLYRNIIWGNYLVVYRIRARQQMF